MSAPGTGSLAILGPGGVGGFLAAALERAGDPVTLVARQDTARAIDRDGLRLDSLLLGEITAHPRVVSRLEEPVDVLVVATKATTLDAALEHVMAPPGLVVPLLNGIDHVARLRERFGDERVVAGTIRIEADRPAPGVITQTSPFLRVDLASDRPEAGAPLAGLAERLRAADVPVEIGASEAQVLWGKLVRLNALACTTSAWDVGLGAIREDPERRRALEGCVSEAAQVARADGAAIADADVLAELEAAHATLGSSMQRDIAAGRPPELDAIPGAVLRGGRRHGIPCPNVEHLVALISERLGTRGTISADAS